MNRWILVLSGAIILTLTIWLYLSLSTTSGSAENTVTVPGDLDTESLVGDPAPANDTTPATTVTSTLEETGSGRPLLRSERISLPLSGSAPTRSVLHTISIEEIRQGCFRQDCIPSIDNPTFIPPQAASQLLAPESLGIALSYKTEERFYPFPMLETHELVNDVVAGDPLLISYCPLCGTGIVFDRRLDGEAVEFGVSGMLWQSNLLMYNRALELTDRNLWSQVLGEAVVGDRAGQSLAIIPSDIMRFSDWRVDHPGGEVLSGEPRDPYDGRYVDVALRFEPNFDSQNSPLAPDTYVYGIVVDGVAKAYPRQKLPEGETKDTIGGQVVTITKRDQSVQFSTADEEIIPDVEGFWFSWSAAYPGTLLWDND